jgi:hypothetical protein
MDIDYIEKEAHRRASEELAIRYKVQYQKLVATFRGIVQEEEDRKEQDERVTSKHGKS